MSEKETAPAVEKKAPAQQMFVVPPALMRDTLDLLQSELSMSKCRNVVLQLEQCRIASINPVAKDNGTASS